MNKEDLIKLGLSDDLASAVISLAEKQPHNRIDNHSDALLKKEIESLKKQLSSLKAFEGDNTALKKKIAELEKNNELKAKEYSEQLLTERKLAAVKFALLSHDKKPHDADLVVREIDLSKISLDEAGKIASGLKEQHENILSKRAYLFKDEASDGREMRVGSTPRDASQRSEGSSNVASFGKAIADRMLAMRGFGAQETNSNPIASGGK